MTLTLGLAGLASLCLRSLSSSVQSSCWIFNRSELISDFSYDTLTETLCRRTSCSYLVMPFMGTDLGKLMKIQRLSEEKVQYLVYQMLKGLKVVTDSAVRRSIAT